MNKMNDIMDKLRKNNIFNEKERIDYLNRDDELKTNGIKFIMDESTYFMVRPSGTEPKIKIYYIINGSSRTDSINKQKNIERFVNEKLNSL